MKNQGQIGRKYAKKQMYEHKAAEKQVLCPLMTQAATNDDDRTDLTCFGVLTLAKNRK